MTGSRVVVLCIAVALSTLVASSAATKIAGLPSIFEGPVLAVLIAATVVCWVVYVFAVRYDRQQRRDRLERIRNFEDSLCYLDGRTQTGSGSWRRRAFD